MSEKFGLDWMEKDSKRMAYLLHIYHMKNKRSEMDYKKEQLNKNHGR